MFELQTDNINENHHAAAAQAYYDKYRDFVELYESHSQRAQAGLSVGPAEIVALGQKLDTWSRYQQFCESANHMGALGTIPNIALDVIAAVATASIGPLLSSDQPIGEEQGTVYAKRLSVVEGMNANGVGLGGTTAGDQLHDTLNGGRVHDPRLGGGTLQYSAAAPFFTSIVGTTVYNVLTQATLRPFTVHLAYEEAGVVMKIQDDGEGNLLCTHGISGTVDYDTGAIALNFDVAPAAIGTCSGSIAVNVEREPTMTTIASGYQGIPIRAEFFGLRSESGLLADFSFSQRFGSSATDEQAQDLTNEIINVLNAAVISRLVNAGNAHGGAVANWASAAPAGVSTTEHKLSFMDTFAEAERNLSVQAGRGTVNRLVAGRTAASKLRSMPNFTLASGANDSEISLYGYLDGSIPVIRGVAPLIGDNEMKGCYQGTGAFDSPMVMATYLPLFMTDTLPNGRNPLVSHRGAGTMLGIKSVVPNYIANMSIT